MQSTTPIQIESSTSATQNVHSTTWKDIVWYNVFVLLLWHIGALYALIYVLPSCRTIEILIHWFFFWWLSGIGITAGAHRLWSHRSYKACTGLRIFLMLCNSMSFQGSIFTWSRDHRVHHKESDSDGDPHNSSRGFFFAHIGWIMVRKHPNVLIAGKKLNHDDLLQDPVVSFQSRYYLLTALIMCYGIPTYTGHLLGNMMNGFWVGAVFRHVWVLHMTWCVNSVAHFFGYRPYNQNSRARENAFVSICAIGEGYHNYQCVTVHESYLNQLTCCMHSHKYPFDYATSEGGIFFGQWNPTKCFIDFCAFMGWAYDLKRSRSAAAAREKCYVKRSADGEGSKIPLRKLMQGMFSRIYFGPQGKRTF